jgi:hypothetical protein
MAWKVSKTRSISIGASWPNKYRLRLTSIANPVSTSPANPARTFLSSSWSFWTQSKVRPSCRVTWMSATQIALPRMFAFPKTHVIREAYVARSYRSAAAIAPLSTHRCYDFEPEAGVLGTLVRSAPFA